jgi:hypothetical protein
MPSVFGLRLRRWVLSLWRAAVKASELISKRLNGYIREFLEKKLA